MVRYLSFGRKGRSQFGFFVYGSCGEGLELFIVSRVILLLSCSFLVSACGYRFQGASSSLPDGISSIYVGVSENDTSEPGLGVRFTEALRARFERHGVLKLAASPSTADVLLSSRVSSLDARVQDVTGETDVELEGELVLSVAAQLRKSGGQILWQSDDISASESFANVEKVVVTSSSSFAQGSMSSSDLLSLGSREVSRGQAKQAMESLLEECAREVYLGAVGDPF